MNNAELLAELEAYLREEADFNRSWADGRRGDATTRSEDYVTRRLEIAAQQDTWADAVAAACRPSCPDCHKPTGGPDGVHTCSPQTNASNPAPEIDASAGRVDADDAARYRWLRGGTMQRQGVILPGGERKIPSDALRALMAFNFWCSPEALDAAIDRARKD